MTAGFLREQPGGCLLSVKVQPRASRSSVEGLQGDELKVRVAAPPVDDAANEALVRFIGEELGMRGFDVQLIRGRTSRHKVVLLAGLKPDTVLSRLKLPP